MIILSNSCQKIKKKNQYYFPVPKMINSNCLLIMTKCPKPKEIQFTRIYDKEKMHQHPIP